MKTLLLFLISFNTYSHCSTLRIATESKIEDFYFEPNPLIEIIKENEKTIRIDAFQPGEYTTIQVSAENNTRVFKYKNTSQCEGKMTLRD